MLYVEAPFGSFPFICFIFLDGEVLQNNAGPGYIILEAMMQVPELKVQLSVLEVIMQSD